MNTTIKGWGPQLAGMFAIGAALVAVFWAAEGIEAAWPAALIMLAFISIVHFGRQRSNTLEVMSGVGDERVRSLYQRAVAYCGMVMAFLLPGWWLVTVAQGDPNETLNILCAIFGVTFVVAVVLVARRG